MTPLIPHKLVYAFLFAAIALVLAAPAGARPILDGAELGDTAVPVAPDAFERAVTAQASTTPLWEKALMARSRAMNEYYASRDSEPAWLKALTARSQAMNAYYGAGAATVRPDSTPQWEKALMARSQGLNEYYASRDSEPAWLKALNARSEAMNAYYGAGSGTLRPDDRGTPRPVVSGTIATGGSGHGIAWDDVTAGALGGFGVALLLGLGGFALVHGSRRSRTIAH